MPSLIKNGYLGQVTSLCFCSSTLLLAATAPYLYLYDTIQSKKIYQIQVFHDSRIHGIKVSGSRILVHGKLSFAICRLDGFIIHVETVISTNFWIYDALVLDDSSVAVLYTNNQVERWDVGQSVGIDRKRCKERTQIYCGSLFGTTWETLKVISGTMYQQIVIWSIIANSTDTIEVETRLTGHEGAIFNIEWNGDGTRVASVSDDRTVRLWDVATGTVNILHGHTSRVWKTRFTDNYLLSIGEDAFCRVWDLVSLECIAVWEGHAIINIWSIAISPDCNIVATGGGDSGIRLWSLDSFNGPQQADEVDQALLPDKQTAKTFAILDGGKTVIASNTGHVYLRSDSECSLIHYDVRFRGWVALQASASGTFIAIGSMRGDVLLLSPLGSFKPLTFSVGKNQVSHIHIQETSKGTANLYQTLYTYIFSHLRRIQ
jgi:WD repeat-containing protein 6